MTLLPQLHIVGHFTSHRMRSSRCRSLANYPAPIRNRIFNADVALCKNSIQIAWSVRLKLWHCFSTLGAVCQGVKYGFNYSSVFQTFLFAGRFWLQNIIKDPHILAHINMGCPVDRYSTLKLYISEPILDSYEYVPAVYELTHCTIWP